MKKWNKTILCLDDEESIIESYKEILGTGNHKEVQELSSLSNGLKELYDDIQDEKKDTKENLKDSRYDYDLLFAKSGEEAIKLAKKIKTEGREIAVGFFDMRLEGKLDGLDVIREIKNFMPNILCSIVTAYTDRTREQIGILFNNQDEWIYFNKPFTRGELLQTACNLVSSWNLRRTNEAYLNNLNRLIQSTSNIEKFDLLKIDRLKENILKEILGFLDCNDGLLIKLNAKNQKLDFEASLGKSEQLQKETLAIKDKIFDIALEKEIIKDEKLLLMPITALSENYIAAVSLPDISYKKKDLLKILLKNTGAAIGKSLLSKEAIEAEIDKGEAAVESLKKISSTLCHHINNPLAVIKGFSEIVARETKSKEAQNGLLTIEKSCDVIHDILEILTSLNKEEVDKTIDTDIGIQLIDIEKEVELIKEKINQKYQSKKVSN